MTEAKAALRRAVLEEIHALSPAERAAASLAALRRLALSSFAAAGKHLLAYYPMLDEVAILPYLERSLRARGLLWLPRIAGDDLVFHAVRDLARDTTPGLWGIREPHPRLPVLRPRELSETILVLTPGLAFDRWGRRLGRGRGYYDRWLRRLRAEAGAALRCVAVAYHLQVRAWVPAGPGDERMDAVITDRETVSITA